MPPLCKSRIIGALPSSATPLSGPTAAIGETLAADKPAGVTRTGDDRPAPALCDVARKFVIQARKKGAVHGWRALGSLLCCQY
jgi:hypothetical protein